MKNKKFFSIFLISVISASSFLILFTINSQAETDFEPQLDPPNQNLKWDFNKGDTFGWTTSQYINGSLRLKTDSFYKVSDLTRDYSNYWNNYSYMIKLVLLEWNSSKNTFQETETILNSSLINISTNFMYPGDAMNVPPFMPKNGTDLAIDWCANALNHTLGIFGSSNCNYSSETNSIILNFTGGTSNYSIQGTYNNEGILEWGEYFADTGSETIRIIYNRLSDLNPFNEIGQWKNKFGDVLHFETHQGAEINKTEFKITEIKNSSCHDAQTCYFAKTIRGNISIWEESSSSYVQVATDALLGAADEHYPVSIVFLMMENDVNYLNIYPQGSTGKDIAEISESSISHLFPEIITNSGDNWNKITNTTSGGYVYKEILPTGILKYSKTVGESFLTGKTMSNSSIHFNSDYYNNSNVISGGFNTSINPSSTETTIDLDISVDKSSLLLYSENNVNPTFSSLENAEVFFDVTVNESTSVDNVKITFCNPKYSESGAQINVWWYNNTANGGNGAWQEVQYTDLGGGNIRITTDHLSIFALTYEEAAEPEPSEPTDEIPGYPSLVLGSVILMGIIGVITVYRKKQ